MRPFTISHLAILAEAYCAATGMAKTTLSDMVAAPNNRLFLRIMSGQGCSAANAEKASVWFAENWPGDVPWPDSVPAPHPPEPASQASAA